MRIYSQRRLAAALVITVVATLAAKGVLFLIQFGTHLASYRGVPQRDLTAFYVLALGIRDGFDPNMPLPNLGSAVGLPGLTLFPHPTPHPPTAGVLLMPLTWLDLPAAAVLWLCLSSAALIAAIILLLRLAGVSSHWWWTALPVALALVAWQPVNDDLVWGNASVVILLLLTVMTACLIAGRPTAAGILLGVCLLLKPVAWPVLLGLVVRRQWRSVASCAASCSTIGLIALALIGPLRAMRYLTQSLPFATQFYQRDLFNISAGSLVTRLFDGVEFPMDGHPYVHAGPLVYAPDAAMALRVLVIIGLVAGMLFAVRNRSVESTVAVAVCISVAASPISWSHYLVWGLLPAAVALRILWAHGWPKGFSRQSAVIIGLFALPPNLWVALALLPKGPIQSPASVELGVGASVFALAPMFFVLGLAAICAAVDRLGFEEAGQTRWSATETRPTFREASFLGLVGRSA